MPEAAEPERVQDDEVHELADPHDAFNFERLL